MHEDNVKNLNATILKMKDDLTKLKTENEKSETGLLKDFQRAENTLEEKLIEYDNEMNDKTDGLNKISENYNKVKEELNIVQNLYNGIMEEKIRKDVEEAKIKERDAKQAVAMKRLNKAAEWVQAHWKGLLI
jgi:chromosome segregation ATPase